MNDVAAGQNHSDPQRRDSSRKLDPVGSLQPRGSSRRTSGGIAVELPIAPRALNRPVLLWSAWCCELAPNPDIDAIFHEHHICVFSPVFRPKSTWCTHVRQWENCYHENGYCVLLTGHVRCCPIRRRGCCSSRSIRQKVLVVRVERGLAGPALMKAHYLTLGESSRQNLLIL